MNAHKESSDSATEGAHVETVGAFDIRIFIGSLIGLFGLLLVGAGLFGFDDAEAAKTGGVNANLWAGIVMVVVALGFVAWTKLEPLRIVVSDNEEGAETPKDIAPAG
ncbi:hypothetical protein CFK41_15155 [Brachybacterium ginsengisoli]|uniref:Uncharacterized protein n=1 Tax=Brachybacterium ginsengisoli TaxID=1331682 RepID=A0A291H0T2_9MICO|nr:hypothetical protein [Brachybacterium ginsengisoli]ATG55966.1 hypothetical protein CFK41_15155 [Brachybacterium ginsengisoli]